ncbi:MAG TPA: SMI1/KNR4 family protein [Armatimonadota bacterium]|nr:SMI1/KNR4 family protein [Armatimonadota bacterium]
MSPDVIEVLAERLLKTGLARSKRSFTGYTPEEVRQLATDQGVARFPAVYERFLLKMGRRSGRLLAGTECPHPRSGDWREEVDEIMEEYPEVGEFPDDGYVFASYLSHEFLYFRTSEGDDPPVYHYSGDSEPPEKVADHLSEYLLSLARW